MSSPSWKGSIFGPGRRGVLEESLAGDGGGFGVEAWDLGVAVVVCTRRLPSEGRLRGGLAFWLTGEAVMLGRVMAVFNC